MQSTKAKNKNKHRDTGVITKTLPRKSVKAPTTGRRKGKRAAKKASNRQVNTAQQGLTMRRPSEIMKMKFSEADLFLKCGILAKGQPMALFGPGGVGKSRLVLQLAISLILRRPFLGLEVNGEHKKVLVFQTENNNRRFKHDLRKMTSGLSKPEFALVDEHLCIHTIEQDGDDDLRLHDAENIYAIATKIREIKPDIVVFDPLNGFAKGNLNSDPDMLKTCTELRRLARLGNPEAAIVIVHHAQTKGNVLWRATGPDRASYGRNSKSLHGWVRGSINIAPADSDDTSKIVLACAKNSNGPEFKTFGAKLNPKSHFYEFDPTFDLAALQNTGGRATVKPAEVANLVHDKPLKKKALVAAIMQKTKCKKSTAYAAIKLAIGNTITFNTGNEITGITK